MTVKKNDDTTISSSSRIISSSSNTLEVPLNSTTTTDNQQLSQLPPQFHMMNQNNTSNHQYVPPQPVVTSTLSSIPSNDRTSVLAPPPPPPPLPSPQLPPKPTVGSFRYLLEQAIQLPEPIHTVEDDDNGDETFSPLSSLTSLLSIQQPPMIDYWRFKKRLKFFAKRRCHILHLMQKKRRYSNNNNTTASTSSTSLPYNENYYDPHQQQQQQSQNGMIFYDFLQQHQSQYTTGIHNTMNQPLSLHTMEDIYTNVPLSYNLSMDPHAHIGMGPNHSSSTGTVSGIGISHVDSTTGIMVLGDDVDYIAMNDTDTNHTNNDETSSSAVSHPPTVPQPPATTSLLSSSSTTNHTIPPQQQQNVLRSSQVSHNSTTPTNTNTTTNSSNNKSIILRHISILEKNEIISFLEWEMDQCYMYYLSQFNKIIQQYYYHYNRNHNNNDNNNSTTPSLHVLPLANDTNMNHNNNSIILDEMTISQYIEIGDAIIELIVYCTMNIIIVQQILTRYDALVLSLDGTPMYNYYIKKVLLNTNNHHNNSSSNISITDYNNTNKSSYYKVRYHTELYTLANEFITTIMTVLSSSPSASTCINDNISNTRSSNCDNDVTTTSSSVYTLRSYITHFQQQMDMFRTMLDSIHSISSSTATTTTTKSTNNNNSNNLTIATTNASLPSFQNINILPQQQQYTTSRPTTTSYWYNTIKYTFVSYYEYIMNYGIQQYIQMGLYEDRLGLEPGFLTHRGQSYTKEMECIVQWRNNKNQWYNEFYTKYYPILVSNHRNNIINQSNQINSNNKSTNRIYYYNYYSPLYHSHNTSPWTITSKTSMPNYNQSSDPTSSSSLPNNSSKTTTTTTNEKKLSSLQVFHLTLNMMAAFLYCMNYYIVEPSSTMYVNRLGAHDAMSGTLIGMMPLAAFVSSIPYSMWTNRSFRHPFIMSSVMLILGNLLYSLADQFGVIWIALVGRFMAGLGAPKCIIRRYMADTTPVSLRTSVNAGFGMVVAAGSAMGPAMAILLNRIEYTCYVKHIGLVTLNGLTLPGYFMACLWLTFFIIVVLTFEEPDREGLKEQKELEARGAIPYSPSNMGSFGVPDEEKNHYSDSVFRPPPSSNNTNNSNHVDETFTTDQTKYHYNRKDDELYSVFSGEMDAGDVVVLVDDDDNDELAIPTTVVTSPILMTATGITINHSTCMEARIPLWIHKMIQYSDLITLPVRICLGLLFCKVFTIEALVSSTSALTKNRYQWQVTKVGKLGFANGVLVIPFSILVGRLSMSYQDHVLMKWLVSLGCCGMFLLVDLSDLSGTPRYRYNAGHILAVAPRRYILGYFLSYLSIQAFEGVIGSTLSKVIPTALASGTFNSGLLATLVDTFGRTCGDLYISAAGFLSLRQLMNLLFIPGFIIMLSCLIVIERCRDLLSV